MRIVYRLSIVCLSLFVLSCGTVPKLEGCYTSAVNDDAIYFESEKYTFKGNQFSYVFSTDMMGYGRKGSGTFKQSGTKTTFFFSDAPDLKKTRAVVKTSPSDLQTFEVHWTVKVNENLLPGVNILLRSNGDKIKKGYSTDGVGKAIITISKNTEFPVAFQVSYFGLQPYNFQIDEPVNYNVKLSMEADMGNLISSVVKEKNIRKKDSLIYINGKKFKKIAEE